MFDQIRFIQTEYRCKLAELGDRQIAVDQVGLEFRFDQRHDDDELIDVRDEYVFLASRRPGENATPWFDPLDHSFAKARVAKPNAVTGRDETSLIRGDAFEEPADGTANERAVRCLDDAFLTMNSDDPA